MHQHSFASHTPEEMRRLSNIGHIIEGALLGAVAILALLNALGGMRWVTFAWSLLLLFSALVLLFLVYARHPVSDWSAIWNDMQQRQHSQMAVACVIAGAAELIRASSLNLILALVFPIVLILIGTLFIIHEQHGMGKAVEQAVVKHRILGATIVLAGLLRVADIVLVQTILASAWSIVLLAAAVRLLLYREPEGAYETHSGHNQHQ